MNFPKFSMPKFDMSELKALPTIAFGLMLGAGAMLMAFAAWIVTIIAYGKWMNAESVANSRITGLATGMWIALGLVGLVVVALAFGKIHSLSIQTPTGMGGTIHFDDHHDDGDGDPPADDPPH